MQIFLKLFTILSIIQYKFWGNAFRSYRLFHKSNLLNPNHLFRLRLLLHAVSQNTVVDCIINNINQAEYDNNRIKFNMNLQSKLMKLSIEDSKELLSMFLLKKVSLQADTVNIFLKHAIDNNDINRAVNIFDLCIVSKLVIPSKITLNIMMDAFRRIIIMQNFNSIPTTIASEKEILNSLNFYFGLFEVYDLEPDSYTYSCLIQVARSKSEVLVILNETTTKELLNPPILRCAIETLGKLNEPSSAILVAMFLTNNVKDKYFLDIFESVPTGDALLVALLQNPATYIDLLQENKSIQTQFGSICTSPSVFVDISAPSVTNAGLLGLEWIKKLDGLNAATAAMQLISPFTIAADGSIIITTTGDKVIEGKTMTTSLRKSLKCSSKGYCALFTFLQREIRKLAVITSNEELNYNNSDLVPMQFSSSRRSSNGNSYDSIEQTSVSDAIYKLYKIRDMIWKRFKTEVVDSITTAAAIQSSISTVDIQSQLNAILLNGRLIDSVLRTYLIDIDGARLLWKNDILPLLKLFQFNSETNSTFASSYFTENYRESIQKGFEALIFLSGRNMRQDLALEIAKTVSKRKQAWFNTPTTSITKATYRSQSRKLRDKGYSSDIYDKTEIRMKQPLSALDDEITSVNKTVSASTTIAFSNYCQHLYRSYCYGKKLYMESYRIKNTITTDYSFLKIPKVNEFLSQGLENSIQLELGILKIGLFNNDDDRVNNNSNTSSSTSKIERIRIKF